MNGSVAKEIRRIIYGSDFSHRERKFEKNSKTGELRNTIGSRRFNYLILKKLFYEEGIRPLRKDSQRYIVKEKPKELPAAPVFIPISKYEFMDQAKLTLPKKAEFWLIRVLRKAYYTIKKVLHS